MHEMLPVYAADVSADVFFYNMAAWAQTSAHAYK